MARNKTMVIGLNQVLRKFDSTKESHARAFARGLYRAGLFLQRESQKIVPVDTGHLRGSAGTKQTGTGFKASVKIYYTAAYAVHVHENLAMPHKEGKTAKFLEIPARIYRNELFKIILAGMPKS